MVGSIFSPPRNKKSGHRPLRVQTLKVYKISTIGNVVNARPAAPRAIAPPSLSAMISQQFRS
jgi:hypothetical protein